MKNIKEKKAPFRNNIAQLLNGSSITQEDDHLVKKTAFKLDEKEASSNFGVQLLLVSFG
jgi:hypothetical protein